MEIKIIQKMLLAFAEGKKITDLKLRSYDFSDQEILQVEKLEYIDCVDVSPWGDRIYMINQKGLTFAEKYKAISHV